MAIHINKMITTKQ